MRSRKEKIYFIIYSRKGANLINQKLNTHSTSSNSYRISTEKVSTSFCFHRFSRSKLILLIRLSQIMHVCMLMTFRSRVQFRYPAIYGDVTTTNFGRECNRRACVACIMCMQYTAHRDIQHRKLRTVSYHVTTGKNFRVVIIEFARLYIAISCRTKVSIICIFAKSCRKIC